MAKKSIKDIKAAAGGSAELARKLKISRAAVSQWKVIPVNRVASVSEITGIPRHELRPDIFEAPRQ